MGDLDVLRGQLRRMERVVVAFSGGADSAFLAWVANDTLGAEQVLAATAVSPSLAAAELDDCRSLAEDWRLRWRGFDTHELERTEYVANGADRCYHCKAELLDTIAPSAAANGAMVSSSSALQW